MDEKNVLGEIHDTFIIEEKPEVSPEEIKAFMAEPEQPKAPEPMILDDLVPGHENQDQQKGRLTTQQIADLAYTWANAAAANLDVDWRVSWLANHTEWVNYIINTAANPNGYDVARELYETEIMKYEHDGFFVPPFSKLTTQEKAPWFLFRSIVVGLLQVWAGH